MGWKGVGLLFGLILSVLAEGVASVQAGEFHSLFLGARSLGLGGAFTAVADDEQAVFFNPAGLAGIQKFNFNWVSVATEVSDDLLNHYSAYTGLVASPGLSSLNNLIGQSTFLRGTGSASFVAPYFGVVGFGDGQGAVRLKNLVFPDGELGALATYGLQAGFGIPIALKSRKVKVRIGFAGKYLNRSGKYSTPSMSDLVGLNTSAFVPTLTNLGSGFGMDFGTQVIYSIQKASSLQFGFAVKDIGDTSFTPAAGADPQKMDMTGGLALLLKGRDLQTTVAFDYDRILEDVDWRIKTHFGMELKFPLVRLYAGFNQLNLVYGAGLDVGLFRLTAVSYAESLGSVAFQDTERRSLVQMVFKLEI